MASPNHAAYTVKIVDTGDKMDRQRLELWRRDQRLLDSASELCFILASCHTDKLPAFIFFRPQFARRRWQSSGRVATLRPSEIVPWWVFHLFGFGDAKSADHAHYVFDSTSLGVHPGEGKSRYTLTAFEVQTLCRDNVLSVSVDQGYLYFELERSFKAKLLMAFGTDQWSNYRSHLLSLAVLAYADCYIEPSWSSIQSGLAEVIESTILPFFTANREIEGMVFEPILPEVLNFITQYSISQGVRFKLDASFVDDMLPALHARNEVGARHFIDFCKLKDEICQFIIKPESKSPIWNKDYVLDAYRSQPARFKGFLGFALHVLLISKPKLNLPTSFPDLRTWWLPEPQCKSSTIVEIARALLSLHEDCPPLWTLWLPHTDHHTKAALAHAMIEPDRFAKQVPEICGYRYLAAKLLLEDSLAAIETQYLPSSLEFGLASAALVNCCTAVKNTAEGQSFAFQALELRGEDLAFRHDTICLKYALARSFVGERNLEEAEKLRKMKQAKKIFEDLLKAVSLSDYFTVLVTLDLNRLKRRLGDPDACALDESSILWSALGHLNLVRYDLQVRFLDELCDIIDEQVDADFIHLKKPRPILEATKEKIGKNHLLQGDASLLGLESRCKTLDLFSSTSFRSDRGTVPNVQANPQ